MRGHVQNLFIPPQLHWYQLFLANMMNIFVIVQTKCKLSIFWFVSAYIQLIPMCVDILFYISVNLETTIDSIICFHYWNVSTFIRFTECRKKIYVYRIKLVLQVRNQEILFT